MSAHPAGCECTDCDWGPSDDPTPCSCESDPATCPRCNYNCPHDSLSGDEGPVRELGRMPVRWRCDSCDAIVYDDVNRFAVGVETNQEGR